MGLFHHNHKKLLTEEEEKDFIFLLSCIRFSDDREYIMLEIDEFLYLTFYDEEDKQKSYRSIAKKLKKLNDDELTNYVDELQKTFTEQG